MSGFGAPPAPEPMHNVHELDGAPRVGKRQRTRSAIAKSNSAKGAQGEREVLGAFRDVMRNIEEELTTAGHRIVGRSDFTARKRIEKGTSSRDLGNMPLIAVEVKRRNSGAVADWWEQACRQASKEHGGSGELPVLVYRADREPWTVRTWLAFTGPRGEIVSYVQGEVTLPDFLAYYAKIYRAFLMEGLS